MHHGKPGKMNYRELFEKTYKGKKVFLTGHTGFKGSWMLAWLHKLGAKVKGYALAPEYTYELYHQIKGDALCDSVIADILNKEKLAEEILDFQPDFLFHFAAQPLVRRSYEQPLYTFEVNINGTAHVLEAVRRLEKKCAIVLITTDKVYENYETDYAYKENDKLGGYDPYSASKAAAELVISSYRNSFFKSTENEKHGKAIAVARAGNVIGGGDFAQDRIIPDIIKALKASIPVIIRNPQSVRPWQHVLEPLSGYLLLGANLINDPCKFAESWNFGPQPGDLLTVEELVQCAINYYGAGEYLILNQSGQPHETKQLRLDINRAKEKLGWQPLFNSREAIRHTINWYKEVTAKNALDLINQQIEIFCTIGD